MLTTCLTQPLAKLIIIEDDIEEKGDKIFPHIIRKLCYNSKIENVVVCQFSFRKTVQLDMDNKELILKKFTNYNAKQDDFKAFIETCSESLLLIDSLSHMIYKFGLRETYKLLNFAKQKQGILQILTLFHSDLLQDDQDCTGHFLHLSSLYIKMEEKFQNKLRLSYTFKKSRGKLIHEYEQYELEADTLKMMPIEKIDAATIVRESVVSPDSLTTFKIELNENDKLSRSQFNLPYLPPELKKEELSTTELGGKIHYDFDEGDDWDAEDPDDDLDI